MQHKTKHNGHFSTVSDELSDVKTPNPVNFSLRGYSLKKLLKINFIFVSDRGK